MQQNLIPTGQDDFLEIENAESSVVSSSSAAEITPHDLAIRLLRENGDLSDFEMALSFVRYSLLDWYQDQYPNIAEDIQNLRSGLLKLIRGCEFDPTLAHDMDERLKDANPRYMTPGMKSFYDRRNVQPLTTQESEALGRIRVIVDNVIKMVDHAAKTKTGFSTDPSDTVFNGAMSDRLLMGHAQDIGKRNLQTPERILAALNQGTIALTTEQESIADATHNNDIITK